MSLNLHCGFPLKNIYFLKKKKIVGTKANAHSISIYVEYKKRSYYLNTYA